MRASEPLSDDSRSADSRSELPERSASPPAFQFTLRHLFALTAAVCLIAAAYSWFGPVAIVAVVALAFVGALITGIAQSRPVLAGELLVLVGILCVAAAWLASTRGDARGAARRMQCQNNLKQLALAIHLYHDDLGCFPPPYIADSRGNPMHSWRVLLLPYMEQQALYNRYR